MRPTSESWLWGLQRRVKILKIFKTGTWRVVTAMQLLTLITIYQWFWLTKIWEYMVLQSFSCLASETYSSHWQSVWLRYAQISASNIYIYIHTQVVSVKIWRAGYTFSLLGDLLPTNGRIKYMIYTTPQKRLHLGWGQPVNKSHKQEKILNVENHEWRYSGKGTSNRPSDGWNNPTNCTFFFFFYLGIFF